MPSASLLDRLSERLHLSARLDNTASVARDHLANERTFLAWLRTSLNFASVGVAMTQLFRLTIVEYGTFTHHASMIVGSLFVALGMAVLVLGTLRYFHVQEVLQTKKFPAARVGIAVAFFLSFSLVTVALALLIVISKRHPTGVHPPTTTGRKFIYKRDL